MQFLKYVLDFVFPPRCEICRSLGPDAFCQNCKSQISHLKPTPFVHSVAIYDGPLKVAITKLKYKKKMNLSKPLGEIIIKYIKNNMANISSMDFIVPVPLHKNRHQERGFNQSDLLSHEISHHFGIPTVSGLLHRVRETKPQFDLPRKERFQNVKGAFEVKSKNIVKDKKILLFDDIYTTGSTIYECTRALRDGGASQVYVLTLSRANDL